MIMDNDPYNMKKERNPGLEDKITELVFFKVPTACLHVFKSGCDMLCLSRKKMSPLV